MKIKERGNVQMDMTERGAYGGFGVLCLFLPMPSLGHV